MQIKTTMRYHLTLVRWSSLKSLQITKAGKGTEKREPSYTTDGNVSWCSHYGKTVWRFLKKLELPYDPAIPLSGIYPNKTTNQKDTCTPMFKAALFTIAKTQKQPKCPSTDEWIKQMNTHNGILLLLLSRFSRARLCATPQTAAHQAPLTH